MNTVVIAGGGLAGISAARGLRAHGHDGRIVLVGEEAGPAYDRPPLSKDFLAGRASEADLALSGPDEDLGLETVTARAAALDAAGGSLVLDDGSRIAADGVVVATGARPLMPWPGAPAGVHTLRTLDDARAIRTTLLPGARLVVVGAGFVGAEVASTAYALGVEVTVVDAVVAPLAPAVGGVLAGTLLALHADHGVRVLTGTGVVGFVGTERVTGVVLADGHVLPADVVVVGVGVRPDVEWLEGSGLAIIGGLQCDAWGATANPHVVGLGDCATWQDPRLGRAHRIEHWTAARERGAIAAATLLTGGATRLAQRAPYFWSDQYGVRLQVCGHPHAADAAEIVEGSLAERDLLAVYRRGGEPVAALALGRASSFARWRKQLSRPVVTVPAGG